MDTILRDLSIVWTLIHCLIMFMFLYESRYSSKKTNIITGIFVIPLIIVNLLNVRLLGIEIAGRLIIPCCVLPSLVFFFIMAKNRGARFLFTFCVVDTIVLEILLITNLLDGLIGIENYIIMFVSRLVIFPLLEFLIVRYIRKQYHFLQQNMKKGWCVFSILAAFFYVIIIWSTYYPTIVLDRPEYIPQLVLILVLVPVMYMTVFQVLWTQVKLFNAAEENRALNMQIKMVNERLVSSAEAENNLQILRHDIKHKMLLINDYIKNKKFEEAEEYISTLISDIDKNKIKSYCDNHSVNVVLSYYDKIAGEKGARFETNVNLPETLTVNETDLAVVLSNGIENAINAVDNCENKEISVKVFMDTDKIYVEIKNPFSDKVIFDGNMPKSKQENHGFGTKSMAAIVDKYEGVYSFNVENEYFIFQCSI